MLLWIGKYGLSENVEPRIYIFMIITTVGNGLLTEGWRYGGYVYRYQG
jgi:hypothetical protein